MLPERPADHMRMNADASTRLPRLSIALVSAAALGYEVLLMRLFSIISYNFV